MTKNGTKVATTSRWRHWCI